MIRNHVLLWAIVLLLFKPTNSARVTMDIEMHSPTGPCQKYLSEGLDYLEIKYARILQYSVVGFSNYTHAIATNIICTPKTFNKDNYTYHLECDGTESSENLRVNTMIAVTAKNQMMSGGIDYRYDEKSMKLIQNGFLDVDKLNEQHFLPNQHISVREIRINGVKKHQIILNFGDCQGAYPKRLIADHGMYMSIQTAREGKYWHRLFFDPVGLGEAMRWVYPPKL